MKTCHDLKEDKILSLLAEITGFIRSHDSSYEKELLQANEIKLKLANLTRYANAIQERIV